ncbi:galactose-1-epimerase [Pasteurellaceae bacterium 22721_9_1]
MLNLWEETTALAPDNAPYKLITLRNNQGMRVQFMDWGASWISCQVPVKDELREVLLGCKPEDYPVQQAFMGASIGRYANRIAHARYVDNFEGLSSGRLDPKTVSDDGKIILAANQGEHQLHGGPQGFDKVRWKIDDFGEDFVCFYHFSPNQDQGFPGNVAAFVTYQLTEQNEVIVSFEAINGEDTPLNLTNHAYFNLNNAIDGCDVRTHFLQLNADAFLPVDAEGIPNSPLKSVENTSFDFRQEKMIGTDFLQEEQKLTKGYDHSFLLNQPAKTCAILTALDRSLRLEISTSQSALQIYTGNYLQGNPTRIGTEYQDYSGIALETQALPDTPNHPEWWQYGGISKAGEDYCHWTKFSFR